MEVSKESIKKTSKSSGIILLILIFAVVLNVSSCNRNIGLKSGGSSKSVKSKCKCKTKKGGIFADYYNIQNKLINSGFLAHIDVLG